MGHVGPTACFLLFDMFYPKTHVKLNHVRIAERFGAMDIPQCREPRRQSSQTT